MPPSRLGRGVLRAVAEIVAFRRRLLAGRRGGQRRGHRAAPIDHRGAPRVAVRGMGSRSGLARVSETVPPRRPDPERSPLSPLADALAAGHIRESAVGDPRPSVAYRPSGGNLVHQAYQLCRFEDVTGTRLTDVEFIVEFGGGYGALCRLAWALGFRGAYAIYDFPGQRASSVTRGA